MTRVLVDAEGRPTAEIEARAYLLRFARSAAEVEAAQRLRHDVFGEMGEGLASSRAAGRDEDEFDAQCAHMTVVHRPTGDVVGTYRLQTAEAAARGRGWYSDGEFVLDDLGPDVLGAAVEVGRACVASAHRNRPVLHLLWRGIGAYLFGNGKRVLLGCSSFTGTDPAAARAASDDLARGGAVHPGLRVRVRPACACPDAAAGAAAPRVPILFRAYLKIGAKVCGGPAIDRAFGTTDFLVLADLETLDSATVRTFAP